MQFDFNPRNSALSFDYSSTNFIGELLSNMKVPKVVSSKFYEFSSELRKYQLRPSKQIKLLFIQKCIFKPSFFAVKLKFPSRGTREDFIYNGSFHEAVGFVLAFAQLFGIMPVGGVRAKTPQKLKFRKFSLRFLLCIGYIIGLSWMLVLEIIWISGASFEFGKLINFIFDFTNFFSILCFLELARKWPTLMAKWNEVEKFLPQLKYQMDKQKLAYEIKMVSFVILFISMGEL
jgi:gustatory receptor